MRFVAIACLLWTGCVYLDPIREHPTVTLSPATATREIYRADRFRVTATLDNPDRFDWRAHACSDSFGEVCAEPFYAPSGAADFIDITVPLRIGDDERAPLTQSIRVSVEARDDRGALAVGASTTFYPVKDAPPSLELRSTGSSYTVGTLVELFAKYGDPDDGVEDIALQWSVVSPTSTPPIELDRDIPEVANDPAHVTAGKQLFPQQAGPWDVLVVARDPLGTTTERHLTFTVAPDRPPCLAQWQPIVAPVDAVLPITAPTLFQVPVVIDDLDSYPRAVGGGELGTATFAWSLLRAGAPARQLLVGATGNSIELDPGAFTPGDIVELRVEVLDRSHTPAACADELATCSIANDGCLQRQTWRLEVR